MAARAGAQTIEAPGASHSIALSQPKAVADLIRTAVAGVSVEAVTA
jgi:pimeloyl-ACP methyl ester carboxylesterase